MLTFIDKYLNKITMYKLVLYTLYLLLAIGAIFAFFGMLPFSGISLIFSAAAIMIVCWIVNRIFAWLFKAPTNVESVYITALILALIITPLHALGDTAYWSLAIWGSTLAIASKYILAIGKKHIFNPAAFGVAITALFIGQAASWWVGTAVMLPFVIVLGFLIVRKIRRINFVTSFLVTAVVVILVYDAMQGFALWPAFKNMFLDTPVVFFACIMLTEPLTTPPTKNLRYAYGILTGIIYAPFIHLFNIESTPELALITGNIFSYLVSPKQKLTLTLKSRSALSPDTHDLTFESDKALPFEAGQYLEWTLPHEDPDNRGNRRYFTIASAPSEAKSDKPEIHLGVKFYEKSSSFKKELLTMKEGSTIVVSQLAGDFVLPKDTSRKLVFIAGGIGITPFVSMVKEMLHRKERRPVTLMYANKTEQDIAYRDLFERAEKELGLKVVHALSGPGDISASWKGERGFLNAEMIFKHVPDHKDSIFYISGPQAMVSAADKMLEKAGVRASHIKKDFFPGFA